MDRLISVLKVTKKPDGYYLQLTGKFEQKPLRQTGLEAKLKAPGSISPTLARIEGTDKSLQAFCPDPKLLRRKEKLQQQLARQQYLGSNWRKTKRKITRIEQDLAAQAKAHNQKLSTFLVRTYAAIDTGNVGKNKVAPKPKKRIKPNTLDPIAFDPNGAEAISRYNKALLEQRTGQFVALVKQKSRLRSQ